MLSFTLNLSRVLRKKYEYLVLKLNYVQVIKITFYRTFINFMQKQLSKIVRSNHCYETFKMQRINSAQSDKLHQMLTYTVNSRMYK